MLVYYEILIVENRHGSAVKRIHEILGWGKSLSNSMNISARTELYTREALEGPSRGCRNRSGWGTTARRPGVVITRLSRYFKNRRFALGGHIVAKFDTSLRGRMSHAHYAATLSIPWARAASIGYLSENRVATEASQLTLKA